MKQLKLYGKKLGIALLGMIILTLILSILNFFGIFIGKISHVISFLFMLALCFYMGLTSGKLAEKKGYIEGLKIGGLLVLFLLLIDLIFFCSPFSLRRMAYYFILLLTCTISSMIGINKKK